MVLLILSVLAELGPVGIDFSAIPVQKPARGGFDVWITVHATNGDIYDNGGWMKCGVWSREFSMLFIEVDLEDAGCKVKRCGNVLVVQTLNGSPVTRVEVRVKEALGAAPGLVWALRSPQDPKAVAPPPRKVKP